MGLSTCYQTIMKKLLIIVSVILILIGIVFGGLFYLDYTDYNTAKEKRTIISYENYLNSYPSGYYTTEAKIELERAYFEKAQDTQLKKECDVYLKKYPNGKYEDDIQSLIMNIELLETKEINTVEGYYTYINKYPNTSFANNALQLLLEYTENYSNTIASYQKLLDDFPKYSISNEIKDKLINRSTWKLYYGDKESDYPIDVHPTFDGGFIALVGVETKIKTGVEIRELKIDQLIKLNEAGYEMWVIDLHKEKFGRGMFVSELNNQICLLTDKGVFFFDYNGNLIIDKYINLEPILGNYYGVNSLFCKNDAIYITSSIDNRGIILKLSEHGHILNKYVQEGETETKISSVDVDKNGNVYFIGSVKYSGVLFGKLSKDFDILINTKGLTHNHCINSGNKCWQRASGILLTHDNNLLIAGYTYDLNAQYSSKKSDKNTFIAKMDLVGKILWTKNIEGTMYGTKNIVETKKEYVLLTNSKRNSYGDFQINRIKFDGTGIKNDFQGGKYGESTKAIVRSENGYLIMGNSNGSHDGKPGFWDILMIKYNENFTKIGSTTIVSNIENTDLDINLDLNNLNEVNDFLKYYRFDYFQYGNKNNYSFTLNFYPTNSIDGVFSWTMFTLHQNGKTDVSAQRQYKYTIGRELVNNKLYINSDIGEIYLESDGTMVMHDTQRNEKYFFRFSKN